MCVKYSEPFSWGFVSALYSSNKMRVAVRPRLLVTADSTARAQLTPAPDLLWAWTARPQCSARPRGRCRGLSPFLARQPQCGCAGGAGVMRSASAEPGLGRGRGGGRAGRARAAAPGPTMKRDVRILLLGEGRRLGPGRAGVSGPGWGGRSGATSAAALTPRRPAQPRWGRCR